LEADAVGSELEVLENQLAIMRPQFEDVLAGMMPPERLIRTVMVCAEKTPQLLTCTRQSLFNSSMSAAILGLECDGVTGQAFLLPFKNTKKGCVDAQLLIGYKGYNTLGARAGLTITGQVIREGDEIDYRQGTGAFVHHKIKLGNKGKIIGAWAQAESRDRPPIVELLGIDEIEAIRKKSKASAAGFSPWDDVAIGFPAMAGKSAKRRLPRSMPLTADTNRYHMAARMDEAHDEQGRSSYIKPEETGPRLVLDSPFAPTEDVNPPADEDLTRRRDTLKEKGDAVAKEGMAALQEWWQGSSITEADRTRFRGDQLNTWKTTAASLDFHRRQAAEDQAALQRANRPTSESEYEAYFKAWLADIAGPTQARARWSSDDEKGLRDRCNVSADKREELFGVISQTFGG